AAGPELLEACRREHPEGCPTGEARITEGYGLPARYVIHTVGPVWRGGGEGEPELLAACYRNSVALAAERGLNTLALPAISCGVYGYPLEEAASVALRATSLALRESGSVHDLRFVLFHEEVREAFARAHAALDQDS
ncbi:MAG: macro domain-containing protein, partial [Planctomycetes bacterium]|nr:macro domain-containing protein [Planctomycetota bacterium]